VYSPLSKNANRTIGRLDEGDWLVSGYKFFCSATDCDVALMLAKTESEQLSLFLAPTRRIHSNPNGTEEVITNGIRFHRLKNKMGTKELPTAELELKNVRAWLVGPLDRGIATIATLLNVTRTHNFVTALSCWRRGMAITKNFAKARTTINQPLWTFPMHLRLLAGMETKFQGMLQLAFFTTSLLSFVDNGFPSDRPSNYAPLPSPGEQTKVVQRVLTAAGKAVICKVACISLQECQEAMGGVGFMDEPDEPEHNISRLYRDTAANMIWEGTTNVLASEIVRHLLKGSNLNVFSGWIENSLEPIQDEEIKMALINAWSMLKTTLIKGQDNIAQTLADGRQIMFSLAWAVSGILLAHDAQRDQNPLAVELAKRWVLDAECGIGEYGLPRVIYSTAVARTARRHAEERLQWDCRIVWNSDLPGNAASGLRQSTGDKLLDKKFVHSKKQTDL